MLIIWRGAGPAVFIIVILAALLTNIVTSRLFDESNYPQTHSWAQTLAFSLAGTGCWFLGRFLHSRPGQVVINKATGFEVTLKPEHSFFFIKLEYFGPILFVIGFCILLFER